MRRLSSLGISLQILVLLALLTPGREDSLWAQPGAPYATIIADSVYATAIARAQEILQKHMADVGIPGLTAAALVDGRLIWTEGLGFADVENRLPVWPRTKMRIGSVSKSLTSVALALLYEQGKLLFDAPIQKYVPSFPEKRYAITIRQVAGHLAGIRHYRNEEFLSSKPYGTVLESLSIFENDTLLSQPGEKYSYSSYGWNLLSAVVEGASGEDFLTFMQEQVFQPLGMRNTVADHVYNIIYNRADFYVRNDRDELVNAPFVDNSYKWAGGGYLSTAEDLVKFGNALINGGFLRPATIDLLFTSLRTNSGEETRYGLGWRIWDLDGQRVVGHTGGSVGGSSVLGIIPEEKIVFALICNLSRGNLLQPGREILKLFRIRERDEK